MNHDGWESFNFFLSTSHYWRSVKFFFYLFLFQISASWVGPRTHFWSIWDPCQHCCSAPTVNTRSSPNNLNGTWWVSNISTSSSPISHYWRCVNFTVILTILFFFSRFPQVVSVLELIDDVVVSLVSLVDLLLRLIRTCRGIWSVWTAGQPAAVANDHQNEVPPTDAEADAANGQNDVIVNEESNIWTHRFRENLSCMCITTFTTFTVHNM